ncbi:hypothetical protein V5O48_011334 [Marasmius crinis-equi]|uniref:Uncharacterized protein n=1 Tax=Marasmius crinis-equi TaxID=585013 RepID=A0ABR3F694_9AGAR
MGLPDAQVLDSVCTLVTCAQCFARYLSHRMHELGQKLLEGDLTPEQEAEMRGTPVVDCPNCRNRLKVESLGLSRALCELWRALVRGYDPEEEKRGEEALAQAKAAYFLMWRDCHEWEARRIQDAGEESTGG